MDTDTQTRANAKNGGNFKASGRVRCFDVLASSLVLGDEDDLSDPALFGLWVGISNF
jgi:hypothetical protein